MALISNFKYQLSKLIDLRLVFTSLISRRHISCLGSRGLWLNALRILLRVLGLGALALLTLTTSLNIEEGFSS